MKKASKYTNHDWDRGAPVDVTLLARKNKRSGHAAARLFQIGGPPNFIPLRRLPFEQANLLQATQMPLSVCVADDDVASVDFSGVGDFGIGLFCR